MLLAGLFDAIAFLTHVQMVRGGAEGEPPTPLRRPGVTGKASKVMNPQQTAYLQAIRDRHEQGEP